MDDKTNNLPLIDSTWKCDSDQKIYTVLGWVNQPGKLDEWVVLCRASDTPKDSYTAFTMPYWEKSFTEVRE